MTTSPKRLRSHDLFLPGILGTIFGFLTPNQVVRVCKQVCVQWNHTRAHWKKLKEKRLFTLSRLTDICEPRLVEVLSTERYISDLSVFENLKSFEHADSPRDETHYCWCPLEKLTTADLLNPCENCLINLQACGDLSNLFLVFNDHVSLQSLAFLPNLETLFLHGVDMITSWLWLKDLPRLHTLELWNIYYCDIGPVLADCKKLKSLTASIMYDARYTILEAISRLTQLEMLILYLRWDELDLLSCLLKLTSLTTLQIHADSSSFEYDVVKYDVVQQLVEAMPHLNQLMLPCVALSYHLVPKRSIASVDMFSLSDDAWIQWGIQDATLSVLHHSKLVCSSFDKLGQALRKLCIKCGTCPDSDLQLISGLPVLESLSYQSSRIIGQAAVQHLGKLHLLRTLCLSFACLEQNEWKVLGSLFLLNSLTLDTVYSLKIATFLVEHVRVETLKVKIVNKDEKRAILQTLLGLPGLEQLTVRHLYYNELKGLQIPPNVEVIDF